MPEVLPVFTPGEAITRTASTAVTGGQLLAVVPANATVTPTAAATAAWLGVAGHDAASGARVTVRKGGVQRLVASGAVTAGDIVVPAAAGAVASNAAPGAGQQVGIAITTAANGAVVEVDMVR
jgi:hypothetical protein